MTSTRRNLVLSFFLTLYITTFGRKSNHFNFRCYKNCDIALEKSTACIKGKDYNIITQDKGPVVVLTIHGGSIEKGTSTIANELASRFSWARYDFSGASNKNLTDNCKMFGSHGMNIASTKFDEPIAIKMLQNREKSVAINSYDFERGKRSVHGNDGMICVGGKNHLQRAKFIQYIKNSDVFGPYKLFPVDATKVEHEHTCGFCSALEINNIVNRNLKGQGLQITLNPKMISSIVDGEWDFNTFKDALYHAIRHAIHGQGNSIKPINPSETPKIDEDQLINDDETDYGTDNEGTETKIEAGDSDDVTLKDALDQSINCVDKKGLAKIKCQMDKGVWGKFKKWKNGVLSPGKR